MGRMFQATIDSASATTRRDLLEIVAGASHPLRIHEILITTDVEQDTNEAQFELEMSIRDGGTSGSGGATATAYALDGTIGATEDNATVEVGNTTQATGGTQQILANVFVNNRIGWHYLPTPETRPTVGVSDMFVVAMQAAFGAATAVAGYVVFEELVG